MKKNYIMGALLATCLSFGQATLPVHEPFNYTAGTILRDQTADNWASFTGATDADVVTIAAGSLSYAGLPASTFNKMTYAGIGGEA